MDAGEWVRVDGRRNKDGEEETEGASGGRKPVLPGRVVRAAEDVHPRAGRKGGGCARDATVRVGEREERREGGREGKNGKKWRKKRERKEKKKPKGWP